MSMCIQYYVVQLYVVLSDTRSGELSQTQTAVRGLQVRQRARPRHARCRAAFLRDLVEVLLLHDLAQVGLAVLLHPPFEDAAL